MTASLTIGHALDVSAMRQRPRRGLRLRIRVALFFTLGGLVVSMLLAFVTYTVARSYLLDQRNEVAQSQAFGNARTVRESLRANVDSPTAIVESVRTEGNGFAILSYNGAFYSSAGLRYTQGPFQFGGSATAAGRQDRVYGEETETASYGLLRLYGTYTLQSTRTLQTVTARLDNATNTLYRNHLNYIKDLVPEMGRAFRVVYSVHF